MARQSGVHTVSMTTQVDLSASEHRFVEQRAGEAGIRLCRAQFRPNGVMTHATADVAAVQTGPGRVKITAGAAITVGALVTTDASGRAIPITGYPEGDWVLGQCEEAAAAAGEVVTILYFGPGARGATD